MASIIYLASQQLYKGSQKNIKNFFADNQFQTLADNGISDSQLYKMAGNSVTTNVVTAIAEKLAWEINQLPNETEETT